MADPVLKFPPEQKGTPSGPANEDCRGSRAAG